MKRYHLPDGCNCKSFVMRELRGTDEKQAAMLADKMSSSADGEAGRLNQAMRESMRLSLVYVDGQRVNENGVPYLDMDKWTSKTMRLALEAYQELNGVEDDEIEDFRKGSEIVTIDSLP